MEWPGLSGANILMDHSYYKPLPMDGVYENPTNSSKTNGVPTGEPEESVTRCICDFDHDDGYMISCDKCSVWQHVDCVVIDRKCIPDVFLCDLCQPRKLDKHRAIRIQSKKRDDFEDALRGGEDSSATETEDETNNKSHRSTDDTGDSESYVPIKKPNRSASPERNSNKKQPQRNHKNDRVKKELKPVKKSEVDKQAKRKKKALQSSHKRAEDSDNGLHHILEAISHKEQKALGSPPLPPPSSSSHPVGRDFGHVNSYTPELQKLLPDIKFQDTLSTFSPSEMKGLRNGSFRVRRPESDADKPILEAAIDLSANAPIVEYIGRVMLRDQFRERWQPHVLFYSKLCGLDLCIDASSFGSEVCHIRRSCMPNAEIRHCLREDSVRFFLVATKSIAAGTEITIAFDFNYHKCGFSVECACTRMSCPVARFQRKECSLKRSHNSKDNLHQTSNQLNSAQSNKRTSGKFPTGEPINNLQTPVKPPVKSPEHQKTLNLMPSCLNKAKTNTQNETARQHRAAAAAARHSSSFSSDAEHADACHRTSPNEEKENSQKKTRDEKKMEAILNIFEKMDKTKVRKKGAPNKQKYKKEGQKLNLNEKSTEACLDSVADAAAALASLSGNINLEGFQRDEIQNISKRYTMQQTSSSSTCISPDAFDINASSSPVPRKLARLTSTPTAFHDGSTNSPGRRLGGGDDGDINVVVVKEEQNSFSSSSNDTHLDAATTLSLMSSRQMNGPVSSDGVKLEPMTLANAVTSQSWECESLPLHQPEGALPVVVEQENKGCSAKKRWLTRAMTSQSSDGDFATPPKKRRLARESITSDDNHEADSLDPIQSPEQKPQVSKSPYQPVCESITDDEEEGDAKQNDMQGSMYCMPQGMLYAPYQSLATSALFGIHPSHPLYTISGAVMDPYRYYSSLNILQNMAMAQAPMLQSYAATPSGTPSPHDEHVVSSSDGKPPPSNGVQADDFQFADAAKQTPEFLQSPYTSSQQFFQKNQHVLDGYFPLVRPLVLIPGAQYPFSVPASVHSLSPRIPLNCDAISGSAEAIMPQINHSLTADDKMSHGDMDLSSHIEMISPPLPMTHTNAEGFNCRMADPSITTHLDSGSLV